MRDRGEFAAGRDLLTSKARLEHPPDRGHQRGAAGQEDPVDRIRFGRRRRQCPVHRLLDPGEVGGDPVLEIGAFYIRFDRQAAALEAKYDVSAKMEMLQSLAGAKLDAYIPVSTITDGVGLNITVHSYADRMDFGLISDRELIPDLWHLVDLHIAEVERLFEATGAEWAVPQPPPLMRHGGDGVDPVEPSSEEVKERVAVKRAVTKRRSVSTKKAPAKKAASTKKVAKKK